MGYANNEVFVKLLNARKSIKKSISLLTTYNPYLPSSKEKFYKNEIILLRFPLYWIFKPNLKKFKKITFDIYMKYHRYLE